MTTPKKHFSLMKLYLALVSLAGIIGIVIIYGQMLHSVVTYHLIGDAEYVQGNHSWEIENCDAPKRDSTRELEVERNAKEIEECKANAEENILMQRHIEYKEDLIAGLTRGVLFILLFVTHFVVFYKAYKREE